MATFVPFPESEELIYKFLLGVDFGSDSDGNKVKVDITFPRLPTEVFVPHVTFFLYQQRYYTNTRNDLLGVSNANFLFSFWGKTPDQVVEMSHLCELALHDFPPFKIGWRILTLLPNQNGASGDIDLSNLNGSILKLTPDPVTKQSLSEAIDELPTINTTLNSILSNTNLEDAGNADEIRTKVNTLIPYIDNLGFTLRAMNKLDILRPQQLESGYYERALEVEFLNGG